MVISFLFAIVFVALIPLPFVFPAFWCDPAQFTLATSALNYPANIGAIVTWINGLTLSDSPDDAAGFTYERMSNRTLNTYMQEAFGVEEAVFPPEYHFAFLVMNAFAGLLFAWYFDTVWPGTYQSNPIQSNCN